MPRPKRLVGNLEQRGRQAGQSPDERATQRVREKGRHSPGWIAHKMGSRSPGQINVRSILSTLLEQGGVRGLEGYSKPVLKSMKNMLKTSVANPGNSVPHLDLKNPSNRKAYLAAMRIINRVLARIGKLEKLSISELQNKLEKLQPIVQGFERQPDRLENLNRARAYRRVWGESMLVKNALKSKERINPI